MSGGDDLDGLDDLDDLDDLGLDSFERELEGLLLEELAADPLDVRLRQELPDAVAERFELAETLGVGGFGAVVRARDRHLDRWCALKLMPASELHDERRARIKREYRAGRRLSHPNVVQTYDLFEGRQVWAFTMELLTGSLRDRLRSGPLPLPHALSVAQELLAALDFVHSEHVVHRDLKPENVLLGPSGADGAPTLAKLADFGIARFGELGDDASAHGLTGTPQYMPPEAFEDGRFDPRGDLYAFGLVLLEMLAGHHPLGSLRLTDWGRRHREVLPSRPEGVPDLVWEVVTALLDKAPERRPRSAREVFEHLAALAPPGRPLPALRGGAYLAVPPLVGRDAELRLATGWLEARLSDEPPRQPPVVWLRGAAGMGKSRLLRRLLPAAGAEAVVLHGQGKRHAQRPYAALARVVSQLARDEDAGEPWPLLDQSAAVASTFGVDSVTRSATSTAAADDGQAHAETAQRVYLRRQVDGLLRACERRPHLLVVEDLHWCDEASLTLLAAFAQALDAHHLPGALLLTSRPVEPGSPAAALRESLLANALAEEVALAPLDREATTRLVGSVLLDDPRAEALGATLHRQGTTPLLLMQTLHLLQARGALARDGALDLTRLPQTVQQVVGERVAHLPGVTKELLAMGSVLGSEFNLRELAACLEADQLSLLDHLDEAEREGVIAQRARDAEVYGFVHDELRDALLDGLGEAGRGLHRRAALGLVRAHGEASAPADRVAQHLGACEDWPGAWRWGRRAAEEALAEHGFAASADHFDRAFAAAERAGITPDATALRRCGDAQLFAGRHEAAGETYRAALDRLGPGDEDLRVSILGRLAELEARAARLTRALDPLEALIPHLGGALPTADDGDAAAFATLERELTDAAAPTPVAPSERARLEVLCTTFSTLAEVAYYHRPDRRLQYCVEGCRLARRLGTTSGAAQAFATAAFMAAQEGLADLVARLAEHALRATSACGDPVAQMYAKSMVAAARFMTGATRESVTPSGEAWGIAQRIAEPLRMMSVSAIHAMALAALGRTEESAEVVAQMRNLGARYGYERVYQMSFVSGCVTALAALRFAEVLEHAAPAERFQAAGNGMLAFQMRSYGALAGAFLDDAAADPELALTLAERWHASGFESMLCNVDANALLVGALAARRGGDANVARLEERVRAGWEPSHKNRAKTGLFLASAGLWRLARGEDEGAAWLAEGIARAEERGLLGDLAVIRAARERLGL